MKVLNFNEKVKYYREKENISKSELARRIKVSPSYITQIEKGEKINPSLEIGFKLSKALNVPIEVFSDGFDEEFKVGDRFDNLKNGTSAEIDDIKGGVATMKCYEKIYGFFKIHNELYDEVATRTIHLKLLKKGIKEGIFRKVE